MIYRHTFPVRIHDVDAAGIVFFARYWVLMHDVYESFLDEIGHSISKAIGDGRIIIPVAQCEARYHRPVRHGETVDGRLTIDELKRSSYVVNVEFFGPGDDLRTTLRARHVCVDAGRMKPTALPADLHQALEGYRMTEAE